MRYNLILCRKHCKVKPAMVLQPELLLPAGDPEKLRYAIAYGADAVYLGLPMASLRTPSRREEQFTPANLPEAISYCHHHGVKAYITLNIFAGNRDLDRLIPHLEQLNDLQPDALILSDPGVFRIARRYAPLIPVHLSTQANTLNVSACAFWQDLGVERVILAREVPLREMAEMHEALPDLQLECFVHGALCVAYSGRCMISDYLTDNTKNSNKGMCGNSCRWEFEITEKTRPDVTYTLEEDEKGTYLLNSKDLCLVRHLPALAGAGICSFKVEGRTKGIHYVATVGKIYREAIDAFCAFGHLCTDQVAQWEVLLQETTTRGFTDGFLYGKPNGTAYHYPSAQIPQQAVFVANATGEFNTDGLIQLQGRNRFDVSDALTWMTPAGSLDYRLETVIDQRGFHTDVVQPNQCVWVKPPADFTQDALSWSMVRRKEHASVVA